MKPHVQTMMMIGLGLGTTFTFSSSHWFLAWVGLEINTLAILPMMTQSFHPRAIEAAIKYFLIQTTAAAMILFASVTNAWITGQWSLELMHHPFPSTLMIMALALKMGLAPLHAWMPEVLQGLDYNTGLIMATWQKMAPFCLLVQMNPSNTNILLVFGLASAFLGGWGGLNQVQLRKVLAYSSIAHIGWMMLVIHFTPSLAFLALILYYIMTFSLFAQFKISNLFNINSLAMSWSKYPITSYLMPFILLSLGGLPPFTGFMPKWLIVQELTKQDLVPLAILAVISALLSLYFYLRITLTMIMTMSPHNSYSLLPWRHPAYQLAYPLAITFVLTILLLPMTPTLLLLIIF
uniref:NADH dehydrogenase subunit 2 n=1 Tax=Fundulus lima TaxID=34780 RepID=UPI0020280283|nr:NADH dehydrogenase subunit 2 [Fundulus lima]UPT34471.1 NADH dehydrogenase subunit 2 [Fundulus lima]